MRELVVPGEVPGDHRIVAASARVERGWEDLVEHRLSDMRRAYRRLSDAPLQRYPKRQFPLRLARFKGVWEYEVGPSDRIFYRVERDTRTVRVEYAGPHASPADVVG